MTIKQDLDLGRREQKALECEVLLAYLLKKSREYLLAHSERKLSLKLNQKFQNYWRRIQKGEPLFYLTHEKEFYALKFHVDERVFLPRPETELLVEEAIKIPGLKKILDLGTGCGCIAIALALNLPKVQVTAVDISKSALKVARVNVLRHRVSDRVKLVQSDLLTGLPKFDFDLVVANLPYIGEKRYNFVEKNVKKYEPHQALFGGENGLWFYQCLFSQIQNSKRKPKFILGEFGFSQREELEGLIKKYFPRAKVEFKKDLAKLDRIFKITLP